MQRGNQKNYRNSKNEYEQNNYPTFCDDNSTVALFYEVKLSRNDNIYLYKVERSKSFLKQFASIILCIFGISSTCRRFDGVSVNISGLSTTTGNTVVGLKDHSIFFSTNENDRYLTFDDFTITQPSSVTRIQGYPVLSHMFFADRLELSVSDSYLYSGNDTYLYAIGLRSYIATFGSTINNYLLLAKDVFDPPLGLLSNSRVDLSYKIVISV
ncbi:MAG: hypothetical protein QXE05_04655 [Nitrososphaeria archaeon]